MNSAPILIFPSIPHRQLAHDSVEQQWREAGWRLLSACFHTSPYSPIPNKEIQLLAKEYWVAAWMAKGMNA